MNRVAIGKHLSAGQVHHFDCDTLGSRQLAERNLRLLQQQPHWDRCLLQFVLARFHPRQGQQIFGEPAHALRVAPDDFKELVLFQVAGLIKQGFGVPHERRQRRSQFMRDVGDEIPARPFHSRNLGGVAQHADRAAIRQRCGGHSKGPSGRNRKQGYALSFSLLQYLIHHAQEVRVAHRSNQRGPRRDRTRRQPSHGAVVPDDFAFGRNRDYGVFHAVKERIELPAAGFKIAEVGLYLASGFVQSHGQAADFVAAGVW